MRMLAVPVDNALRFEVLLLTLLVLLRRLGTLGIASGFCRTPESGTDLSFPVCGKEACLSRDVVLAEFLIKFSSHLVETKASL